MRRHISWVIAAMNMMHGCAKEQVAHPPAMIGVLKKVDLASQGASGEKGRLTDKGSLVDPVMRVSSRLIDAARRSAYAPRARALCWTIAVYDQPALRASVRPNGVIAISTGTFRLAETESGLAALLGHELAHALAADTDLLSLSPPCPATLDEPSPLSTYQDELDADSIGLDLMANAGYDPRELLRLWERMRRENQESDNLTAHIIYERRMAQIARRLPEAIMRYERTNRAPQKNLTKIEFR